MQSSNQHIAFSSLFNRYYAGLCVYSESFTGDQHISEDLVQDVFVNVWTKRAELNFDEKIRPYLYRAVHNASIQYLRYQKIRDQYLTQKNTLFVEVECIPCEWVVIDTNPAEANEIQTLYRQALNLLPVQTREIFLYSREKGMKYFEIADLTDLSVKSVEYHISRALEVFRKVLKDYL